MEIVNKIRRIKIFFILLALPFCVNAQYTNLLNNKELFKSTTINHLLAEKDSIVFTGLKEEYDSIDSAYFKTYFLGKITTNETNNYRLVYINFGSKKVLTQPIKFFQKPYGYSIIFKYLKQVDSTIGECGYFLMNYNHNLEFIDSAKFVFKQSNIGIDSTGEFGVYDLFSEVIINSQNHYVFTVIYRKKTYFNGNYEIGNSIVELNEQGKLIQNKAIEYDFKASETSNTVTLTPIVTLEEINLNDSIKYIGFNANYRGGQVYLDSLFNIRKVTNFLITFPIKQSEFKFQTFFVKSIKRNNTIYVAGPGDSIVVVDGGAKNYIPSLLIKKIVNGETVRTLCLQTMMTYSLYDDIQFESWFQNNFLNVNSKNEIFISIIISSRYTFLALLDSNLNLIWEKYLDSKSLLITGYFGALSSLDNKGFYIHGYSCDNCNLDNKFEEQKGFIGYISNKGNLLGLEKSEYYRDAVKIFPNPATEKLFIENNGTHSSNYIITNLLGQEMDKGFLKSEIDICNLPKGVYILKIVNDKNQIKALKFVKQ